MPPRSIRLSPLLVLLALSAGCTPRLDYEQVCTRDPAGPPIDDVNVESEGDRVRLSVYAAGEEVTVWETTPPPARQADARLAAGERYFRSGDGGVVGVRRLERVTPGATPGRVERRTSLRLLGRAGRISLPPGRLDGAFEPHISGDASTLLLASAPSREVGPMEVRVYRTSEPEPLPGRGARPRPLPRVRTYTNPRHGKVQLSRRGDVIAQEDGAEVRILDPLDPTQLEKQRLPAGIGFQLAPSGRVLAVREPDGVVFHTLGAAPPTPVRVPVSGVPQAVEFEQGRALVLSDEAVTLHDPLTGDELWRWEAPEGVVTSADLFEGTSGEFLVAVGRLDVLRPAMRSGGSVAWGEARAYVDVLDSEEDCVVRTHSFTTARWNDDAPEVHMVAGGRRVLVRCGDIVLLSEPLP